MILFGITVCKAVGQEPLVAFLNEKIQTQDSVVTVDKVLVYPNEESVYGPDEENYGMPVTEEYRRGPVVVLSVEKPTDFQGFHLFNFDWLDVQLFSDGKKLSSSGSGEIGSNRMIFGFSFWAELPGSRSQQVEFERLGELDLSITVYRTEKIFNIPLYDIPRNDQPVFEDENVQIQEIRWQAHKAQKKATVQVKIKNKTESSYYAMAYKANEDSAVSLTVSHFKTVGKMTIDISAKTTPIIEFWKVVPLAIRKFSSLKFSPWSDHPRKGNN